MLPHFVQTWLNMPKQESAWLYMSTKDKKRSSPKRGKKKKWHVVSFLGYRAKITPALARIIPVIVSWLRIAFGS